MAINVTDPIGEALTRTGLVLFKPLKLKKWMVVAVPLALMLVGEGLSPIFQFSVQFGGRFLPHMTQEQWLEWIQSHLMQIVGVLIGTVLVATPVYLWMRWVNARGYFIFYDNLVKNEARVKEPWREFRELGNSLMKLRIWWDLIMFNVYLVIAVIGGCLEWPDVKQWLVTGQFTATGWTVGAVIFVIIALLLATLVLSFAHMVIFKLAVPVMYIRRMEARAALKVAWRELFLPNKGVCIGYFLFFILIGMVAGMVTEIGFIVLAVVTACVGLVVMFLPVVGNYPLALAGLPALTYDAAFQLYFVSQFGPEYQVGWHVALGGGFPVITEGATDGV